jgi:hypothetical protein
VSVQDVLCGAVHPGRHMDGFLPNLTWDCPARALLVVNGGRTWRPVWRPVIEQIRVLAHSSIT